MNKKYLGIIALSAVLLACATPQPFERKRYDGPERSNAELVTLRVLSPQGPPGENSAVQLIELDGKPVFDRSRMLMDPGYIQVLPGEYRLKGAYTRLIGIVAQLSAAGELQEKLKAGHVYSLKATELTVEGKQATGATQANKVRFELVDHGKGYDPACFLPVYDDKGRYVRIGHDRC